MKTKNNLITAIIFSVAIIFSSCEEGENLTPKNDSILPGNFKVEIPDALSHSSQLKSSMADTLGGDEIYEHLGTFIHVGEEAAEIVEEIIRSIRIYNINKPMELSYESNDDGRVKHLVVVENSEFEGATWEFQLTITDELSEGEPDGGNAIQVFWNRNPIKGIALLKPYNIDRKNDARLPDAVFRIDYSEAGDISEYDAYMVVQIAGLPVDGAFIDKFALNSLQMFVGKKRDIIDVYGNSNHPNASFFTEKTGFNWAFVASGKESLDIGVAEVGLPPSDLDEEDRAVLLEDYSIKSVLTEEINEWFLETWGVLPDSASLSGYLKDADAPGYFNNRGFVAGGESPGTEYDDIESRLEDLTPYNPYDISNLTVEFK